MEVLKQAEERYLRYDFSATEIYDLSMKLANSTKDKQRIEDEKKAVSSQYKSQIDALNADIQSISTKVSSGYEMRKVECKIEYHKPEMNKKTIIRSDTNEKIIEKMTSDDHNLFNQYKEEDTKTII